jgi:23S rRNA U2552 (ribose-2'-O)-methylase RlmE/FtsJ
MDNWGDLENSVRQYAHYIWNRPANADRIAGVNFDCVVKLSEIELVAIEITKNRSLDKIREDISKIQTIRMTMMMKNIMVRPFIICDYSPTQGMKDAGKENI